MPALLGWVLPLEESAVAIRIGMAAGTSAAAVLAISALELDAELRGELAAVAGGSGGSVVVRSSSPLEADLRWSGAFATYLDVRSDDLEAAVRGCWASAFSRDAIARGELLGVPWADRGVAVLIQPWIAFDGGGVATLDPEGGVRISVVRGAPSDLMAGRVNGSSAWIGAAGELEGDREMAGLGTGTAHDVASLVRDVHASLGEDTIEWGVASGAVSLLQVRRAPRAAVGHRPPRRRRTYPQAASRVAFAAASCPGPLGERWVLPWAPALDRLPVPARVAVRDVVAAVAEAYRIASELASASWELPAERAFDEAHACYREILGPEPFDGLARLSTLRPPDMGRATRLLGLVAGIGESLRAVGTLPGVDHVWRLTPGELERAAGGHVAPTRTGPDRWEPFVFSVAQDRGRTLPGRSGAPGIGAGRTFELDGPSWTPPPPRRVLVVSFAVPQLASLIWGAAGLVAQAGNEGAHLFEVARSLGVPAVLGVEVGSGGDRVVAVNGDDGTVSILSPGGGLGRVSAGDGWSSLERRTG